VTKEVLKNELQIIEEKVKKADTIAIFGHLAPDGDCIGSILGAYMKLKKMGKDVDVYLEDPVPDAYKYLHMSDEIRHIPLEKSYDVLMTIDLTGEDRMGDIWYRVKENSPNAPVLVIDHHVSNERFGDINIVDTSAAAAAEIIYFFFEDIIDEHIAQALINGIMTDSGFLAYESVKPRTVDVVRQLRKRGGSIRQVRENLDKWSRFGKIHLWGIGFSRAEEIAGGKGVVSYIKREDMKKTGTYEEDIAGLVSVLRSPDRVYAVALLSEAYDDDKDEVRISFRSNDPIEVHILAKEFGGGGHPRAAGARVKGEPIESVLERVKKRLAEELMKYDI